MKQSKKEAVNRIRGFWNSRARLGKQAGTRDVIAKQLEIGIISNYIKDGMRVLDAGCGNGITAIELARRFDVDILGIDSAAEMVSVARASADRLKKLLRGRVRFETGDATQIADDKSRYDIIYSERMIINLRDWRTQRQTIANLTRLLRNKGKYLMCENSQDGLDRLNKLRSDVSLPIIDPPWHNRYIRDAEINGLKLKGAKLVEVLNYSSTYYFLSRIVNAWQAKQQNLEPSYEAPVNQLALKLPPIGNFGQGQLWVWQREMRRS